MFTEEHARKYAAKWRADERKGAPTDEALRETFAGCVRPAHPAEYPLIREAIKAVARAGSCERCGCRKPVDSWCECRGPLCIFCGCPEDAHHPMCHHDLPIEDGAGFTY